MNAALDPARLQPCASPFDLDNEAGYRRWRADIIEACALILFVEV